MYLQSRFRNKCCSHQNLKNYQTSKNKFKEWDTKTLQLNYKTKNFKHYINKNQIIENFKLLIQVKEV